MILISIIQFIEIDKSADKMPQYSSLLKYYGTLKLLCEYTMVLRVMDVPECVWEMKLWLWKTNFEFSSFFSLSLSIFLTSWWNPYFLTIAFDSANFHPCIFTMSFFFFWNQLCIWNLCRFNGSNSIAPMADYLESKQR